ncbi:MAG: RNA polymerase sigma factor [Clostridia bacterium]|nr:RNA polymerase sigma factor [Clostridia bacterium]
MATSTPIFSDRQIVTLYLERNEQAISESDRKYGRYLLTVAQNILSSKPDSEECKNDTYLRAWNAIPPEQPSDLKKYLSVIIRRLALDRYRTMRRDKRVPSEASLSFEELKDCIPASDHQTKELAGLLNSFISALPPRRQFLFLGRYYFAHSLEHLAKLQGCSLSTVNKELAAARKDLRTLLEQEGYTV